MKHVQSLSAGPLTVFNGFAGLTPDTKLRYIEEIVSTPKSERRKRLDELDLPEALFLQWVKHVAEIEISADRPCAVHIASRSRASVESVRNVLRSQVAARTPPEPKLAPTAEEDKEAPLMEAKRDTPPPPRRSNSPLAVANKRKSAPQLTEIAPIVVLQKTVAPHSVITSAETDDALKDTAETLKLLSDETRLRVLFTLWDGEKTVKEICDALHVHQPTISHHLALMRLGNLVNSKRKGKNNFYSHSEHFTARWKPMIAAMIHARQNDGDLT